MLVAFVCKRKINDRYLFYMKKSDLELLLFVHLFISVWYSIMEIITTVNLHVAKNKD